MAHTHNVYDDGAHFIINPTTRLMKLASAAKNTVIQYDHNSERFTFELPRYIEGHDMLQCNCVEIHYLNIETGTKMQTEGLYLVEDLQVCPDEPDTLFCTWLISRNATKYVGKLHFLLRFACVTEDDTDYVWSTAIYSDVLISQGLYCAETILEQYSDILAQWKLRIDTLELDVADLQYEPIAILSFQNSVGSMEIGSELTEITFSWNLNRAPETLTLDDISQKEEAVGAITQSGLHIQTNKTFTLKATDERGAVATRTTSILFLNGVYYGVSAIPATLDSAFVLTLTKELRSNKKPSFTANAGAGQYIYYCLPKRFGTCAFTVGGFTGGFTLVDTIAFTNASGYTEDYYIYRSDNAALGSTSVTVG